MYVCKKIKLLQKSLTNQAKNFLYSSPTLTSIYTISILNVPVFRMMIWTRSLGTTTARGCRGGSGTCLRIPTTPALPRLGTVASLYHLTLPLLQVVAVVSCMFVVVSTLCLIFSTLPQFQQKDDNGIDRKQQLLTIFPISTKISQNE